MGQNQLYMLSAVAINDASGEDPHCCSRLLSNCPPRAAPPKREEDQGNSTGSRSNRPRGPRSSRPGWNSRNNWNCDGSRRTGPCRHIPEGKPKGGEAAPRCSHLLSNCPHRATPPKTEEDQGNSTGSRSNRPRGLHSSRPGWNSRNNWNCDGSRRTGPCRHIPEGKPKGGEAAPRCSPLL